MYHLLALHYLISPCSRIAQSLEAAYSDACENIVAATATLVVAVTATQTGIQTEVMVVMVLPLMATEVEDHMEVEVEAATVEVLEATRCLILELASRHKNGVRSYYLEFYVSIFP